MARAEITNPFLWKLQQQPNLVYSYEEPDFVIVEEVGKVRAHRNGVTRIATSSKPNWNVVLTSGRTGNIIRWTMREDSQGRDGPLQSDGVLVLPETVKEYSPKSRVTDIALSGGGEYAVNSWMDGTVTIWDVETGEHIRSFDTGGSVSAVSISDDNRVIATGSSDDMSLKIWSTQGVLAGCHRKGHAPRENSKGIARIKFEPGNYRRLYSCGGRSVTLWDVNFGKTAVVGVSPDLVSHMDIANDGRTMAYGGMSSVVGIGGIGVPLGGNGFKYTRGGFRTHLGPVSALGLSPNGEFLAAATGAYIVIWSVEDRLRVAELARFPPPGCKYDMKCTALGWSPVGNYLLPGYNDGFVDVVKITDNDSDNDN